MSFAKLRLLVAALLFVGWLGWLAYAVSQKGTVQIVSRAQLAAAPHWVIAEVTLGDDGLPNGNVNVKSQLQGSILPEIIEVVNLRSAKTPVPGEGGSRDPVKRDYLLLLEKVTEKQYSIAGLPRSPGYAASDPQNAVNKPVPVIYPWTDDVQKQMATFQK